MSRTDLERIVSDTACRGFALGALSLLPPLAKVGVFPIRVQSPLPRPWVLYEGTLMTMGAA